MSNLAYFMISALSRLFINLFFLFFVRSFKLFGKKHKEFLHERMFKFWQNNL